MPAVLRYLKILVAPLVALAALTFGLGKLLLTMPNEEQVVNSELAADRSGLWNRLTDLGSSLSDTPYIVAMTAIAAIAFRLVFKRWRESVFIVLAVWSQSLVFLATTELVGRKRPAVEHLDPAPPTSSFPSGHVSAAVCFYAGMALVLALHTKQPLKTLWWVIGIGAPLIVAFSRLYRGMHFPTDVVWGLLLGVVCLIIVAKAVLFRRDEARGRPLAARAHAPSP